MPSVGYWQRFKEFWTTPSKPASAKKKKHHAREPDTDPDEDHATGSFVSADGSKLSSEYECCSDHDACHDIVSSTGSFSKISMRKLCKIRKALEKDYSGQFNFKTGYTDEFKTVKMLGRGAFGAVFLACRAESYEQIKDSLHPKNCFAVKRIKKDLLRSSRQCRSLLLEIEIMVKLRNNLNVCHIQDIWEDDRAVYMVMEYCSGGDLIHQCKSHKQFSEADARLYFQDILRLLKLCHQHKILHRDIKPDNFLKADKSANAPLKMIDFGLSAMWTGALKMDMTGTPFYMAPEVILKRGYGPPADLWSAGCVLYFLVAGRNPFQPCETFKDLQKKVMCQKLEFNSAESPAWRGVSPQLKDLAARLLDRNQENRLTARQALKHPWFNEKLNPSAALNDTVIQKFQSAGSFHRLKRKLLVESLKYLELEEAEELTILFNTIDINGDGYITREEMVIGLKRHGYKISDVESRILIENVDVDGNGLLDQNEFVVALLDMKTFQKQRKWQKIVQDLFDDMDKDKDGQLSAQEVKEAIPYSNLIGTDIDEEVEEIMEEMDQDRNGTIDIREFTKMLNEAASSLDVFDKRLNKRYGSVRS